MRNKKNNINKGIPLRENQNCGGAGGDKIGAEFGAGF